MAKVKNSVRTTPKVATLASVKLTNPNTPKAVKSLAAAVLGNRRKK